MIFYFQNALSFSCFPPDMRGSGAWLNPLCEEGTVSLSEIEKRLNSSDYFTVEGKKFILDKILSKQKGPLIELNLKTFPNEICQQIKSSEITSLRGRFLKECPSRIIDLTLAGELMMDKSATIDFSGKINTKGEGEFTIKVVVDL